MKSEIQHRNVTLVSTNISIKTVLQPAKTSFARLSGSGATDEKIREYKLPALMQLLYNSNGRKPEKCRAEKINTGGKSNVND